MDQKVRLRSSRSVGGEKKEGSDIRSTSWERRIARPRRSHPELILAAVDVSQGHDIVSDETYLCNRQ